MTTGRLLGGAVLILLGLLILGANFGYLDWDFFAYIWQLWPLIVIIIGVQLLFGRRQPWLAAGLTLAIMIGGVALVALGDENVPWLYSGQRETTSIDGPAADGIRQAEARIDVGAARLDIASGAGDIMTAGTFESRRNPSVSHDVSGDTYTLVVKQERTNWFFPTDLRGDRLRLDLAEGVPWKIDIDSGAADVNVDLSGITLRDLRIDAGASSVDLKVGRDVIRGGARVTVDGGAGSYHLRLPSELDITLTTDAGVSSVNVDGEFRRSGDVYRYSGGGNELTVRLSAGVSSISVELY